MYKNVRALHSLERQQYAMWLINKSLFWILSLEMHNAFLESSWYDDYNEAHYWSMYQQAY